MAEQDRLAASFSHGVGFRRDRRRYEREIDRAVDGAVAFVAAQAATRAAEGRKAQAARTVLERRAKALVKAAPRDQMAHLGKALGLSVAETREQYRLIACTKPQLVINFFERDRCETCAAWRAGECWSGDRLDGDLSKEPASHTRGWETCEAHVALPPGEAA